MNKLLKLSIAVLAFASIFTGSGQVFAGQYEEETADKWVPVIENETLSQERIKEIIGVIHLMEDGEEKLGMVHALCLKLEVSVEDLLGTLNSIDKIEKEQNDTVKREKARFNMNICETIIYIRTSREITQKVFPYYRQFDKIVGNEINTYNDDFKRRKAFL